ncbi:NifU family protein [Saccharopolyspora elongata]|uniref:NifU family protein n=1 Tax=Saccharopolyspora elongata TaxID=2530387 RepID=A0A4R4YVN5_9PSEU|nr:NifU family protein [Saccharopolyspora elongata]TDD48584.1 NifU family protein [Saccharopolyspora elongata]
MPDRSRLDDAAVQERLARVDDLLATVERAPGPTADAAMESVQILIEVYGEALGRVVDLGGPLARTLAQDELLKHLMVLHEIHPDPVAERVRQAIDDVRPHVESRGGQVELTEVAGNVARVRLTGVHGGCSSTSADVARAITETVLALVPEVAEVDVAQPASPSMIPVDAVLSRARGGARRQA